MRPANDPEWIRRFRYRLDDFEATTRREGRACSLKWRTGAGRFDRASSPAAYRIIDTEVRRAGTAGRWVEAHSNGPELLVYLVETAGGLAVAREVVVLLAVMARARVEGIRSGDAATDLLELIVRRFDEAGTYLEETPMTLTPGGAPDEREIAEALRAHGFAVR